MEDFVCVNAQNKFFFVHPLYVYIYIYIMKSERYMFDMYIKLKIKEK